MFHYFHFTEIVPDCDWDISCFSWFWQCKPRSRAFGLRQPSSWSRYVPAQFRLVERWPPAAPWSCATVTWTSRSPERIGICSFYIILNINLSFDLKLWGTEVSRVCRLIWLKILEKKNLCLFSLALLSNEEEKRTYFRKYFISLKSKQSVYNLSLPEMYESVRCLLFLDSWPRFSDLLFRLPTVEELASIRDPESMFRPSTLRSSEYRACWTEAEKEK